jgi:hypothetical protein
MPDSKEKVKKFFNGHDHIYLGSNHKYATSKNPGVERTGRRSIGVRMSFFNFNREIGTPQIFIGGFWPF